MDLYRDTICYCVSPLMIDPTVGIKRISRCIYTLHKMYRQSKSDS